MKIAGKTVKGYYQSRLADREPYLTRARQVAALTIPALMPPEGSTNQTLETPYQSVGARGIASLSSKLLMVLFPPNQEFIRMKIPAHELEALGGGDVRTEVEESLAVVEKTMTEEIESEALRPHLHEVNKHLLVSGNAVLYVPPGEGRNKVFHLDRFVVQRDPAGNVLALVTCESISPTLLPAELMDSIKEANGDMTQESLEVYTAVCRDDSKPGWFKVWQEVEGLVVPDSEGEYPEDEVPWLVLRMEPRAGESYGYGYIAGVLGDLSSLEGLWRALVDAAAASARLVFLVNPAASTRVKALNSAPNGSFVTGNPEDVMALKVDKAADMTVAFNAIERLERSLGFAFLLNQSVQRSGERVTAEEIKFLAQELEDVLAGTYSLLAQELQLRLAKVMLRRGQEQGKIMKLPKSVQPTIVTGLEALSRGHDLMKLDAFVQGSTQVIGPEALSKWLNVGDYLKRRATAVGIALGKLVRSEEEVQQAEQAAAQAQLAQGTAPEVIRQAGNIAQQPQEI